MVTARKLTGLRWSGENLDKCIPCSWSALGKRHYVDFSCTALGCACPSYPTISPQQNMVEYGAIGKAQRVSRQWDLGEPDFT